MEAQAGDRIQVAGRTVGQPVREGTVLEAREGQTGMRYRVEWDDGHTSMYMPADGAATVVGAREGDELHLGCTVDVRLTETDGRCVATASMATSRGTFSADGVSRRHPDDPIIPMIGEELAIGRALMGLGAQLTAAAGEAIREPVMGPVHLLST